MSTATATKKVILRPGSPKDAQICGKICHEAFKTISEKHGFPPDFPSSEAAIGLITFLLSRGDVYSVVAESDGRVIGSNFLWESDSIAGVGPVTVDPTAQNRATGRLMMENILQRIEQKHFAGVRLVQAAFHSRSMSLYTKLGFVVREPLVVMQGSALNLQIPGHTVRQAVTADLPACNQVCFKVHGLNRSQELLDAITNETAMVVEHGSRITGYATVVGFFGHAVGETNEDLKALIGAAPAFAGSGLLLPSRNTEVFRWCLDHGLLVIQPLTLMSRGLYNEPAGAFLPSILY
jgi:GNAT superfamily N-acetyltransferase